MHTSWGLYIDIVFLFLNALSSAFVFPRDDTHLSLDASQGPAILPPHRSSQGSFKSHHVSLRSTDAMAKRDDEQSDDLRVRSIEILTGSIPIAVAANSLELFYNAILYNALAPWCTRPPQQALVMTMGPLQLTMNVVVDSGVAQGIPWPFVRNFARNMLAMTALGFTGTYDIYYSRHSVSTTGFGIPFNPGNPNLAVEVRLRILWGM